MFRNYLRTALRHLKIHRANAALNILGLAVGMACCLLVLLWVRGELQVDRFHRNGDRIYRLVSRIRGPNDEMVYVRVAAPAGPEIAEQIPGIADYVRFAPAGHIPLVAGERKFYEDNAYFADSSVFDVFSFGLETGTPSTALAAPYSMVMTREIARKYFGRETPIGQQVTVNGDDFVVTGILEDVPRDSHLRFNILLSMATRVAGTPEAMVSWSHWGYATYFLLDENTDKASVEQGFPPLLDANFPTLRTPERNISFELQPLLEVYLHSGEVYNQERKGNTLALYIFSGVAAMVMLIACLNFINLMTARTSLRAREIGVRKVLGSTRRDLVQQFLSETVVVSVLSVGVSFLLASLGIPILSSITGEAFREADLFTLPMMSAGIILAVMVGLAAGFYPAVYLSALSPAGLTRSHRSQRSRNTLRRLLTAVQIVISAGLAICTIIIHNQITHLTSLDFGFDYRNVLVLPGIGNDGMPSVDVLSREILGVDGVAAVAASAGVPLYGGGGITSACPSELPWEESARTVRKFKVDADFIPMFSLSLIEGRNFSDDLTTDTTKVIINQAAAEAFGWDRSEGRMLSIPEYLRSTGQTVRSDKEVIGVVEDFRIDELRSEPGPIVIEAFSPDNFNTLCVRLDSTSYDRTLAALRTRWNQIAPDYPFEYQSLDESIAWATNSERILATLIKYFALVAIILACLGLIGMSAHLADRRTKEIGIRLVLGASRTRVAAILCSEVTILTLVGSTLASIPAYYLMRFWLADYAYRVSPGWQVFVIVPLAAVFLALATVSIQSMRAAGANPVEVLKHE